MLYRNDDRLDTRDDARGHDERLDARSRSDDAHVFGRQRTCKNTWDDACLHARGRGLIPLLLALLFVAAPAAGQGWIEPPPDRPVPGWGVTKLRTNVSVRIDGRVARVEVEEWFRNDGRPNGEGDYLYPLPGEAVFSEFSLFQGDDELRGEMMDATKARSIYEEIVRRKKDPALIELVGRGLVRARVFPFAAGETRKVTLRYTQVLPRAGDALEFRYAAGWRNDEPALPVVPVPMPRPRDEVEPAPRRWSPSQTGPVARRSAVAPPDASSDSQAAARPRAQGSAGVPLTFTVTIDDGAAYADPFSPTHDVRVTREDGRIRVRPEGELTGDFALFLPFAAETVGITVATHRPTASEPGYFMLTLSPAAAAASRVPRDVTVVVDVSGSMSGEKIEQARAALRQLLGTLGGEDRFRLIRFSTGVATYRPDWQSGTAESLRAARAWVDDLRAEGGTNIAGALDEAFRLESPEGRLPIVVFMTDGLPSAGETNPERIAARAEERAGDARVFAFGVGYDVNTYLLDRLGEAGRGATHYVAPGEDVEVALGALAAKIRHPVLSDLRLGDSSARLVDVYPSGLPDLFAGEELIVFGRYEARANGELTIAGRREGRTERYSARATFPEHTESNEYIASLWASRRLGELTRQVRLNGPNPELIEAIRSTALRYGLLSEYTSYLVQEPNLFADAAGARELSARIQAATPPPANATGQGAVAAAERTRQASAVAKAADLRAAAAGELDRLEREIGASASGRRLVAGRAFELREGVWTDVLHRPDLETVEIEAFSPAYFTLLGALPELEPVWREAMSVLVAGRAVAIVVKPDGGETRLSEAAAARIAREFRDR